MIFIVEYQLENYSIAFAVNYLQTVGYKISKVDIESAFKNVCLVTNFKGRWTILSDNPLIICDTGHNVAAITSIFGQISKMKFNNLRIVFGLAKDKSVMT